MKKHRFKTKLKEVLFRCDSNIDISKFNLFVNKYLWISQKR